MDTAFLVCAILGGTLLVCELLAGMLGLGVEHDIDVDHDTDHGDGHGNSLFGVLTVRTATAAVLFFGLGGLSALYYGTNEAGAFGVALGSGALALYLVAAAMKGLKRLKSDGTVRMDRAVGCLGTVYLRVPGSRSGAGKVHLKLQNRTVECLAVTSGDEIPTGRPVQVVSIVSPDTVEVAAA